MFIDNSCVVISKTRLLTCALFTNVSKVKCWGGCYQGCGYGNVQNIGSQPGDMGSNLPFVDLGDFPVVSVSVGNEFACALSDAGRVKCWGTNTVGSLGQGDTTIRGDSPGEMGSNLPTVDVGDGAPTSVVSVHCGESHVCAVISNGDVKCWGANINGELGLGDEIDRGEDANLMGSHLPSLDLGEATTYVISLSGGYAVCAVLDDASLICWGDQRSRASGYIPPYGVRGLDRGTMDNIPAVDVGNNGKVLQVSVSLGHTCALRQSREIVCWGHSSSGTFGDGGLAFFFIGTYPTDMGDNLHVVDIGITTTTSVVSLTSGRYHTCAVISNGDVKCWGSNNWGELGVEDKINRGVGNNTMGSYVPSLDFG
ncbi:regulator of chromosome condensation 1/beta-lactamase-inhibitor protein II, partial [Baffinella frigidus]